MAVKVAAVAAVGASKVGVVGPIQPASAAVIDRRYTELSEMAGDRGVAGTLTAPSAVNCGGGDVFWDHLQQMVGNHGDGRVVEWMETGVAYCRYGAPTVVLASCFEATVGAGCQYSESPVQNPAPPAGGAKMVFKITNSETQPGWDGWTAYAGGTFIGTRRDFTPGGGYAGDWSQVGLESINMVAGGGSHANGLLDKDKYRDQAGNWLPYGTISSCSSQDPAHGSPFFGVPDSFIYNFAGGAGTCP